MATFAWTISQLDCKPQEDGKTDVVVVAHWRCDGTETQNGKTYNSGAYGTAGFTYTAGAPFTPYASLTKEQVLGWVWESVDKTATEAGVRSSLDSLVNPPIVSPALPW